jgi:hypothetical protein
LTHRQNDCTARHEPRIGVVFGGADSAGVEAAKRRRTGERHGATPGSASTAGTNRSSKVFANDPVACVGEIDAGDHDGCRIVGGTPIQHVGLSASDHGEDNEQSETNR